MKRVRWHLLVLWFISAWTLAGPCEVAQQHLASGAGALEDPHGLLSVEQVTALAPQRFGSLNQVVPQVPTRSAIWLRLPVVNPSANRVQCWLTLGEPRLENLQVFVPALSGWQRLVGGSDYPLERWAAKERQPAFPITLEPGEGKTVLARVSSTNALLLNPHVWTDAALHKDRERTYFHDGIALGIVLLVVPFSLLVSWIFRSRLLLLHAVAVGSYAGLACLISGYLLYWPQALSWSSALTSVLAAVSFMAFLAYLRELLRVRELSRWVGALFSLLLFGYVAAWLYGMMVDAVAGRAVVYWLLKLMYPVVIVAFCWGWWKRLNYNWLAWVVVGSLAAQCLARYVLRLEDLPWQERSTFYSLSSSLGGVFFLTCSLIMVVRSSRQRERTARRALYKAQQAENERLEQTVALRTKELHTALLDRSSLLARISHDLRSPLVGILDHARALQDSPEGAHAQRIERQARQQLALIDELIEFSRDSFRQVQIEPVPGYVYAFIQELATEGADLAQRHRNRFENHLPSPLPVVVTADFRRLRQVVLNLLGNAAKFTAHGLISLTVENLGMDEGQVRLRFEVRDTGMGIADAELDQVLLPFRRGSNAQPATGSGLGLSIVTQLLQAMGSSLHVQSQPAQGSCFSFELSLAIGDEQALDSAFIEGHAPMPERVGRVLLVDDQPEGLAALNDLLTGYGFDVTTAADGVQALQALHDDAVDVVMCDQMMPTMDGWQLLAHIRQGWPSLPVVLYSAAPPRPGCATAGLEFDAALLKPADSRDILATLDRLLGGRAQRS
ncbi:ATP-binding protein [Pseudomonas putida]|uniref:hybrid sensor histidine kinase/response regulator n=1 Tax=Pseudomonas putida TaxID=303 RepID=UPI0018A884BE|nr:ATP-binding protein [Pseudomonas putida]MBF8727060.1 response regulator [Pseudomonas putida]